MGITPQQFRQLQVRLAAPRAAAPVLGLSANGLAVISPLDTLSHPMTESRSYKSPSNAEKIILGIDPSLRGTGYGVIRMAKPHPKTLGHGTIACPAGWEHSRCLLLILQTLREVVREHRPQICVVEGLFFAQNLKTALIMGEARGAALAAAAEGGLEIYEIAPRKVKQAIVGYGAAQKLAVSKMVQRLLALPSLPSPDAADALALALAHAQERGRYSLTPLKRV